MDTSGKLKLQEVFLSVFLCFTPICIFLINIYILVNLCMGCREWLSQISGLSCYVVEEILGGVCWILWSTLPTGFWICAGEGVVWKGSIDVLVSGVKIWGRGSNLGTLPSLNSFHPFMYIMTLLEVVVECSKHLRFQLVTGSTELIWSNDI